MEPANPNPMVPFLAGWLASAVFSKAGEAMKLLEVQPMPPDSFKVTLASGLELVVRVHEAEKS